MTHKSPAPQLITEWVLDWLRVQRQIDLSPADPFLNGAINSLMLLELIAACEEKLGIRIPLASLVLDDLQTLDHFATAVSRVAQSDIQRTWYKLPFAAQVGPQRMQLLLGLRMRLPQNSIVRESDQPGHIRVGLPVESTLTEHDLHRLMALFVEVSADA
ncbi:MAG: acyl carrier protein [Ardenticatenales bacterium]|nr:acyl carrier protein [Ardenticatenales bacterium]